MKRTAVLFMTAILLALVCAHGCFAASYFMPSVGNLPGNYDGEYDGIFVGWSDGDTLFAPGARADGGSYEPVFLRFGMLQGAAVRTKAPAGLRFTAEISSDDYSTLRSLGALASLGTVIAPLDAASGSPSGWTEKVDIPCRYFSEKGDGLRFTGVLTKIKDENCARSFICTAYAEILYGDGQRSVFFADFNEKDNARSVYSVAAAALADTDRYDESERAVLQGYFDTVGVNIEYEVPQVGGKPDTAKSATPDAYYTVSTEWMCQYVKEMHEIFRDDYGYQITVTVRAKKGAEITEKTKLTLNGQPLTKGYTVEDGVLTIIRRYPLGQYTWGY